MVVTSRYKRLARLARLFARPLVESQPDGGRVTRAGLMEGWFNYQANVQYLLDRGKDPYRHLPKMTFGEYCARHATKRGAGHSRPTLREKLLAIRQRGSTARPVRILWMQPGSERPLRHFTRRK